MNCKDCRIKIIKDNIRWVNKIKKIKSSSCLKCSSKKQSKVMKGNTNGRGNKGKIVTKETREKLSNSAKGKIVTKETRENLSKVAKGNTNGRGNKGKITSKEIREKQSIAAKGKKYGLRSKKIKEKISKGMKGNTNSKGKHTDKAKKNMRLSSIKRVERQKLNGEPLMPCIGKYEKRTLDILEESFGYKIERQYRVNGYFLDGYCRMLNLAIEIDELWHKDRRKEDRYREEQIKKELNCQFLRIEVSA